MKVLVIRATGHHGASVIDGLLEAGNFTVQAFVRPESMTKPAVENLRDRGVEIRECDINGRLAELVKALDGIDIVISCVGTLQLDQLSLVNAAKKAGVKRFVPCGFITVAPPGGIMHMRDLKERVYNHIKQLRLPYTIIDVGWWYQVASLRVPSGKVDYVAVGLAEEIVGKGNIPSALTDLRDVGRYVTKIIIDEQTLNRMVFVYNTVMTQNQVYDLIEEMSGEKLERNYVADESIHARVAECRALAGKDATDPVKLHPLFLAEYKLSWGVRGDNNPDYAKYLGYLTSKDLYPDFEPAGFRDYLKSVFEGTAVVSIGIIG
ncbi:hypothetical protein OIDMADRAFT_60829 [Oidiodendron maius Zn]|uniref:NmrA-like domain-containing protein n=1 Tax=Oidiodendron maius (strain Zn) TaxID=913774 RepID=A0A0C3CXU5_OIDMZ|nr:hypothetical protein OIDMADRAFT_60829 [Oidiodendron maius Zn]